VLSKQRNKERGVALRLALGLHGLRSIEVTRLTIMSIDVVRSELHVRSAKRGRSRVVPMCGTLCWSLLDYWSHRGSPPRLLNAATAREDSSTKVTQRAMAWLNRRLGGTHYRFHDLRATAACQLYRHTGDVLAVMTLLGHRHLRSTQEYLRDSMSVPRAAMPVWDVPPVLSLRRGPRGRRNTPRRPADRSMWQIIYPPSDGGECPSHNDNDPEI
jgi:integrase